MVVETAVKTVVTGIDIGANKNLLFPMNNGLFISPKPLVQKCQLYSTNRFNYMHVTAGITDTAYF